MKTEGFEQLLQHFVTFSLLTGV